MESVAGTLSHYHKSVLYVYRVVLNIAAAVRGVRVRDYSLNLLFLAPLHLLLILGLLDLYAVEQFSPFRVVFLQTIPYLSQQW